MNTLKLSVNRHNIEKSILGTLISSTDLYADASEVIAPMMFEHETDAAESVWQQLDKTGKVVKAQVSPKAYKLLYFADHTGFLSNCRQLYLIWRIDREIELAQKQKQLMAETTEPDKVLEQIRRERSLILEWEPEEFTDPTQKMQAMLDSMTRNREKDIVGAPSGFSCLDTYTGGWQSPDQIIIAGRPGMGKTCLALDLMLNAALEGTPCVFFTIEMAEPQIYMRLLAKLSGIPFAKQRRGNLTDLEFSQLHNAMAKLFDLPFTVIDNARTWTKIKKLYRRLAKRNGAKLFFIDYIQLVDPGRQRGENKNDAIERMSRELKALAQENDSVNFPLAQLNRSVESRGGAKRPMLSDLRDSGSLEQDADMVLFPYRADYYGFLQDQDGNDMQGICEVICAKDRHSTGLRSAKLKFVPKYEKYIDADADLELVVEQVLIEKRMNTDEDIPF